MTQPRDLLRIALGSVLILGLGGAVSPLAPQRQADCLPLEFFPLDAVGPSVERQPRVSPAGRLCRRMTQGATPSQVPPGRAFLYSALIPGTGQHLLGQSRWTPYVAVEVWGWIQFFLRRRNGQDLRQRYHDLAWEVARRVSTGPREEGDFGYYESLTHFQASGAFDRDPLTGGIQPETDPETFNGTVWELAGDIFFPPDAEEPPPPGSAAYERALEYYLDRSVSPRFTWNWGDNSLQRAAYTDLIRESDEEFRSSTTMIGLILANHFVSAIDALVSARLRDMGRDPRVFSLQPLPLGPSGRWGFHIRILY